MFQRSLSLELLRLDCLCGFLKEVTLQDGGGYPISGYRIGEYPIGGHATGVYPIVGYPIGGYCIGGCYIGGH